MFFFHLPNIVSFEKLRLLKADSADSRQHFSKLLFVQTDPISRLAAHVMTSDTGVNKFVNLQMSGKKVGKRWKPAEEILHCCSEWILLSHGAWHSAIIVICSPAFLFHCQQIYAIRTDRSIQRGMLCCECLFGGANLPTDRSHDELL